MSGRRYHANQCEGILVAFEINALRQGYESEERQQGRFRGFGTDKGREGVQNSENLADVICACPLIMFRLAKFCCK